MDPVRGAGFPLHCRAHRLLGGARRRRIAAKRGRAAPGPEHRASRAGATVLLEALRARDAARRRRGPAGGEQQARLEDEESSARRQLAVARSSLRAAERGLARRLQTLYVEGEVDPLAVLLGAGIARRRAHGLDGLGHVADQDVSILNQVRRARSQLKRSLQALKERQAALDEVVDDATAQRAALAGARPSAPATSPGSNSRRLSTTRRSPPHRPGSGRRAERRRGGFRRRGPHTGLSACSDRPALSGNAHDRLVDRLHTPRGRTSTGIPTGGASSPSTRR